MDTVAAISMVTYWKGIAQEAVDTAVSIYAVSQINIQSSFTVQNPRANERSHDFALRSDIVTTVL
mgnify:CR=1 FL=1